MPRRCSGEGGEFIKLGLLRHLAASLDAGGTGLTVGSTGTGTPDEGHNADGKHVAYLHASIVRHASLAGGIVVGGPKSTPWAIRAPSNRRPRA